MGLPISTGGINNILQRIEQKALPAYNTIKEKITQVTCIGSDERGANNNVIRLALGSNYCLCSSL